MTRGRGAARRVALAAMLLVAPGAVVARAAVDDHASVPVWTLYDRPATYEAVTEEIRVPMRDGVGMRCTLLRPAEAGVPAPGPYPAIVSNFFAYRAAQMAAFGQHRQSSASSAWAAWRRCTRHRTS
jgi:predicted acyl esterase